MQVIKRNKTIIDFNGDKIFNAINKAAGETELGIDYELAKEISDNIEDELEDLEFIPSVEYIQDLVEDQLMQSNRRDIAKRYILYREERSKLRQQMWEMSDLQRDIYEKKYRFENETFEEFLDRVSAGNSHIKKLIREKKYLPAGRILAGRGLNERGKKVCYSNCFPAKTKVYTDKGYKNIEDIQIGDMVLTHTKEFKPVVNTLSREYAEILYTIKTWANKSIISTNEHPYLAQRGWVNAEDLTTDDYIKAMKGKPDTSNITFDLTDYIDLRDDRTIKEDESGKIKLLTHYADKNGVKGSRHSNSINRYVTLTDELAYATGYWVGDGSIAQRADNDINSIFQIVVHEKQEDLAHKIKDIIDRCFGIDLRVTKNKSQNLIILKTDNPILCEWVNKNFGKYSNGKFVPHFLQNNLSFILGLLDADGMVLAGQSIRLVLNNYNIIKDVKNSLEYLGYPCNRIRYTGRNGWDSWGFDIPSYVAKKLIPMLNKKYDDKRCSMNTIENPMYVKYIDGDLYLKIKNISQFNLKDISTTSKVYNLSVDEDESFIANGLVVHNCFVNVPPEDNLESIFDTAKNMARTYSYGGGCGTSLGNLRPRGSTVNNAAESTTGAVSFADLYSLTTGLIGQSSRRGALMLSMPITHPDIEEFIDVKTDLTKVTKANISVMVTDEFMEAVEQDRDWELKFTVKDTGEIISKTVRAKDLMYKLAENNWRVAEPGILFWDRVEGWHLNSENVDFKYESTNPCGV